jgi:hypothetical protein
VARLGLDPYGVDDTIESAVLDAAERLDVSVLNDFLDAVRPDTITSSLTWVVNTRDELRGAGPKEPLPALSRQGRRNWDMVDGWRRPWKVGWLQAKQVRELLNVTAGQRFDPDSYVHAMEAERPATDRRLQAVGQSGEHMVPAIALTGQLHSRSRQFMLARALWHVVSEEHPMFLITGAYTDRQKVERAFAAELLAPADGIRERLPEDPTWEDVEEVADHFGVSSRVIQHQLENQLAA